MSTSPARRRRRSCRRSAAYTVSLPRVGTDVTRVWSSRDEVVGLVADSRPCASVASEMPCRVGRTSATPFSTARNGACWACQAATLSQSLEGSSRMSTSARPAWRTSDGEEVVLADDGGQPAVRGVDGRDDARARVVPVARRRLGLQVVPDDVAVRVEQHRVVLVHRSRASRSASAQQHDHRDLQVDLLLLGQLAPPARPRPPGPPPGRAPPPPTRR